MVKESNNVGEENRGKDAGGFSLRRTGLARMDRMFRVALNREQPAEQQDRTGNNQTKQLYPGESDPDAEFKKAKDQDAEQQNMAKNSREDDGSDSKVGRLSKPKSITGQQLLSGVEFLSSSEEDIIGVKSKRNKSRTAKIRKSQTIYSSESSDINEALFRMKSEGVSENATRTKVVKERKLAKNNTVIQMENVNPIQVSRIERQPVESSVIQIESDTKVLYSKQPREPPKTSPRRKAGVLRAERISSTDPEIVDTSNTDPELQKPIDVVVHVHYENEGSKSKTPLRNQSLDNKVSFENRMEDSRFSRITESRKRSGDRNVLHAANAPKQIGRNAKHKKLLDNKNKKIMDNRTIEDSLDMIEEFREAPRSTRFGSEPRSRKNAVGSGDNSEPERSGSNVEDTQSRRSDSRLTDETLEIVCTTPSRKENPRTGESIRRTPAREAEKLHPRKRWFATGSVQLEEETRPHQKRWMEETHISPLTTETLENSSSTGSSRKGSSQHGIRGFDRPVPAPRSSIGSIPLDRSDVSSSYDNPAFQSDHEDILRIETEVFNPPGDDDHYRKSTKIELTKLSDRSESRDRAANRKMKPGNDLSARSSDELETQFLTAEVTERVLGSAKGRRSNTGPTFENSKRSDSNDDSRVRRIKRSSSNETFDMSGRREKDRQRDTKVISTNESDVSRNHDDYDSESSNSLLSGDLSNKTFIKKSRKSRRANKKRDNSEYYDRSSNDTGSQASILSTTDDSNFYDKNSHTSSRRSSNINAASYEDIAMTKRKPRLHDKKGKGKSKRNARRKEQNLIDEDVESTETYISVMIHKSDILETDFVTMHPMVKVHIVEINSGNYIKLSENHNNYGRSKYLQPLITGKFDFREKRSVIPNWEEELVFEHDFDVVVGSGDKQVMILFEIMDLLSFAEASFKYNQFGSEGCWHKIAWAFLKPNGTNGVMHINKKIRLQLYKPPKSSKKPAKHKCEVFNWWKSNNRDKYPSSLYVTVAPVQPKRLVPIFYEQLNLNDLSEIQTDCQDLPLKTSDSIQLPKWTRLSAQTCKIPNEDLFQTETSENGCFYVTFSNNGKYLACVNSEEYNYPIVVYTIPEGGIHVQFTGHQKFVYSLNWSPNDEFLLSVSSDQTACLWNVENKIVQSVQMLPHPSYVYCGKFYPGNASVIATGCYDHVARLWGKNKDSSDYELIQELEAHRGFVNSLCFQKDGSLITADSIGVIVMWTVKKSRRTLSKKEWQISKKIKVRDIEDVVINTIVLHPLGSRLLVHSRDNSLRMLDLETSVVLQQYKGLMNQRIQTTSCISPCGGLILCGGEDGFLNIWGLESGALLARYSTQSIKTVSCVDYHPYDHILAYSSFGNATPVNVLKYDKRHSGKSVGLKLLINSENDNNDITMTFPEDRFSSTYLNLSKSGNYDDAIKNLNISKTTGSDPDLSGTRNTNLSGRRPKLKPISHKTRRRSSREDVDRSIDNYDDRRENFKLRLQKLNESERSLKSKSTNRLNNIIEKIDKILLNTGSKCDSGSTQSPSIGYGDGNAQVLSNSAKGRNRKRNEENVDKFDEDLTNSDVDTRVVRTMLKNGSKLYEMNHEDSCPTSDSAITESAHQKKWQSSASTKETTTGDVTEKGNRSTDTISTPVSAGTYVIGNDDTVNSYERDSVKVNTSDSSSRSNVTFIIEKEVPVPKPRRKMKK